MSFKAFFEAAKSDAESALKHIEGLVDADAHKALVDLRAAMYGTVDRIEEELKKIPSLPASIYEDLASKVEALLADVEELITGTHPAPEVVPVAAPVAPAPVVEIAGVDPPAQSIAALDVLTGAAGSDSAPAPIPPQEQPAA